MSFTRGSVFFEVTRSESSERNFFEAISPVNSEVRRGKEGKSEGWERWRGRETEERRWLEGIAVEEK
jgi:hypothetical protein